MENKKFRLGVDIGGTFTDLTLLDADTGEMIGIKTPTQQDDPSRGILNGIELLKQRRIRPEDIGYFVHGMTIGLNTLLQRKGANIALFVTEGFRDLLALQRLRLPVPYDFHSRLPEPIIPRKYVFPIKERVFHDGTVRFPLDIESLHEAIDAVVRYGLEGVVVSFLHSYKNPAHEQFAATIIKERAPQLDVIISSELWPQMREYERTVMAVANLYIQPNVKGYLETLKERLKEVRIEATPFITQSNGGLMDVESAAEAPVRTLFSGPAAGVIGAIRVAESAGFHDIITFDVGGTSADISIVENGEAIFTQNNEIAGFPIMIPSISIHSIGAGGGSIAWIDDGGMLKVGPESVGSNPGPACYGKGEKAALTDAFFICNYIHPDHFAAGNLPLYREKSERALAPIAAHLKLSIEETADRIIQVAVANMYTELSNIMEQHGFDPRDFSLLAYGGAGPLLANFLAEEIQAKNVIIPPNPGTLSALGALTADFIYDAVSSGQQMLEDIPMDQLRETFQTLALQAEKCLDEQALSILEKTTLLYSVDARYKGQAYEIELPIEAEWLERDDHDDIIRSFHEHHQRQYGHRNEDASVEIMNFRVRIIGHVPKPSFMTVKKAESTSPNIVSKRQIVVKNRRYEADVYLRNDLYAGHQIKGPAIIEQADTTVLVLPGWIGNVDEKGNVIIERIGGKR